MRAANRFPPRELLRIRGLIVAAEGRQDDRLSEPRSVVVVTGLEREIASPAGEREIAEFVAAGRSRKALADSSAGRRRSPVDVVEQWLRNRLPFIVNRGELSSCHGLLTFPSIRLQVGD